MSTPVLTWLLLASVGANFVLFGKWTELKERLGEAARQLVRSEKSVEDHQDQLAAARALLALILYAWAAVKEENELLRAALAKSERFGVALGKRYEDAPSWR